MPGPLVTVIIATYNSAALLRLSLASLVAQEYTTFEAWVVGDACTDDSEAVVASMADPRLRWVNLAKNSGSQAMPNNAGLDRAAGDLIAFLGHDDLWFPWHLSGLVARLGHSHADFAHGLAAIVDQRGPFVAIGPPPVGVTYHNHYVPPSAWLYRRQPGVEWERWRDPSTIGRSVDFDVIRRAAGAGARFAFEPRLSVLKFPSEIFRAYAPASDPPEAPFLAEMQRDPIALERRVLTDMAVAAAQYPLQYFRRLEHDRQLLIRSLRVWIRRTVDPYRDAPLVAPLIRALFRRRRRRRRRVRGLGDDS